MCVFYIRILCAESLIFFSMRTQCNHKRLFFAHIIRSFIHVWCLVLRKSHLLEHNNSFSSFLFSFLLCKFELPK